MSLKFRDWQIYNDLRRLRKDIINDVISTIPKEEKYGIISQLKNALNSSILNVAEGAYRKSDKDLAHFLNQSDTSLNEVIACLDICLDDNYISDKIHKEFIDKTVGVIAQIAGFRKFLKNSFK